MLSPSTATAGVAGDELSVAEDMSDRGSAAATRGGAITADDTSALSRRASARTDGGLSVAAVSSLLATADRPLAIVVEVALSDRAAIVDRARAWG